MPFLFATQMYYMYRVTRLERVWHRSRASRYLWKDCLDETNALAQAHHPRPSVDELAYHLPVWIKTQLDSSQVLRAIVSLSAECPQDRHRAFLLRNGRLTVE